MIFFIVLILIFFVIGLIHISWVFGHEYGFRASLPMKETGELLFLPKKIDCLIVGLGLLAFGFYYLVNSGLFEMAFPIWLVNYGKWVIPSIFIIRSIGDFRYVGFFKSIKSTSFGKLDTKFFSPLCLLIGVLGLIVAW